MTHVVQTKTAKGSIKGLFLGVGRAQALLNASAKACEAWEQGRQEHGKAGLECPSNSTAGMSCSCVLDFYQSCADQGTKLKESHLEEGGGGLSCRVLCAGSEHFRVNG